MQESAIESIFDRSGSDREVMIYGVLMPTVTHAMRALSVAAMRIRNVHLAEEAAERRRLEQEVALAREIQVSLLPDSLRVERALDFAGQ